jgi:hypothetical protein
MLCKNCFSRAKKVFVLKTLFCVLQKLLFVVKHGFCSANVSFLS